LGDRVEVQVKGVDYYRQQIDLVAVVNSESDRDLSNSESGTRAESEATVEFSEHLDAENLE
jgi:ribonuclease R